MSFSNYFNTLDPPAKKRYWKKLKLIDDIDTYPIEEKNFSFNINCLVPAIIYPDIVNLLDFGTSPFSSEDMKTCKSLDAYNQVLEGWVIDFKTLVTKSD